MKLKVLLIGGYPRGHDRPFDPCTLSGKRLRGMVEEVGLDAVYLDLWTTENEEKHGDVDPVTISIIKRHIAEGTICVALGKWVQNRLATHGVNVRYLPHPASRRRIDRERLRIGLEGLRLHV